MNSDYVPNPDLGRDASGKYTGWPQTFDCDQNRPEQLHTENRRLRERLVKFEAFARAHETWEARMILEGEQKILDNMSDSAYEEAMEIQRLRNDAMLNDGKLRDKGCKPPAADVKA